jgi:putative heme-binding domain-containing protein
MRRAAVLLSLIIVTAAVLNAADPPKPQAAFELKPGDHICIIGNALAEGMQHDGWLETLLHARFPKHHLVIRNLGFSGDEVGGYTDHPDKNKRLRSMDFGTADQWLAGNAPIPQPNKLTSLDHVRKNRFELTETKADVIFAFFGFNESFAGEAGLPKFKADLDAFIKHTLSQKYNGKSPPRLVLFSPTHPEPPGVAGKGRNWFRKPNVNLPDITELSKRLRLYTAAMHDIAKANDVPFVDFFSFPIFIPSNPGTASITTDGVHLNEDGNRYAADFILRNLSSRGSDSSLEAIDRIHQAVLDKNFYWFNRYRCTDGYSTYGDRAFLRFAPDEQSNYEVVQRELEVIDVMTHNRDKRIWAIASGDTSSRSGPEWDDSNTPPFIPVKTNKPGPPPGGKHVYLDPEDAIKKMTVAKNMTVNLFASEKEFPELVNPVQACWDPAGRLWVAVWPTYPHWRPKEEMNDKILILEDTKGTGKADKCTVFADHLTNPTGLEFVPGGILVAQAPDLMFIENKDGKAGRRVRVLHGLDTADTHHTSNSFALDPGGAVYFQEGTFHHTQVETPWGPPVRNANAGVYRFEPRTFKFDAYVTFGFANPHGHVFDRWGQDVVVDGTGAQVYHAALFSGHLDYPQKHHTPPQVYKQRTRPCPGVEILSSRHFPESMQGDLLVPNVIGFQGILRYTFHDDGASFGATEQEPILSSTDPNFRPSDLKIGPDGAIYFLDWHNPIIGHMQHNLRDPSRDREHGRIYRVTYNGRPLLKSPKIAGEPIEKVLDVLKEPEDRVRYRARIELANRDTADVMRETDRWLATLDKSDANYEHNRLEALWLHQSHNVVDDELLRQVLHSPDFHARAGATRVLCYWRDRVPQSLLQMKELAADPHPRVRLEAVRAASFFTEPDAVEVVLIAAEQPSDRYLDFVRGETMRALDPIVKTALASGKPIHFTTPAGARFLLGRMSVDQLLKAVPTREVDLELLFRKGVRDEDRKVALADLAKRDEKRVASVLIDAVRRRDEGISPAPGDGILEVLRLVSSRDLATVRIDLEKMATRSRQATTRQFAYLGLIAADNSTEPAWARALEFEGSLPDLLAAIPLLPDPEKRAAFYPKIESLVKEGWGVGGLASTRHAVRAAAMTSLISVRGQEESSFRTLAEVVLREGARSDAVSAMLRIPQKYWVADAAQTVLNVLLTDIRRVQPSSRTQPGIRDEMQLADGLASLLPKERAKEIRRELGELSVRSLRLGTLPEQMLFDQERLAVQVGKPVEIVFENSDLMPHNFVLLQPGALEEIGMLGEAQATEAGAAERHYVPKSAKIIIASRLLQSRETQTLDVTAPKEPGIYPYVCTYPGHWRRMFGAMYVVADLDEYRADPEGYLAAHPLTVRDPLLKFNRPRKEWTLAELESGIGELNGRSFANGKQIFTVANCVACHKLNGAGAEFGPDLAKLDAAKYTPADILRDIVEPSWRIDEKYQSYAFELKDGKRLTGVILEETPTALKVIENPLAKAEPIVLAKADIVGREKSPVSMMPKGLLDKLTREEILDLLAYVVARGDAKAAVYATGGGHGHGH